MTPDLATFEAHRAHLLGLAYRMLGDVGRSEDLVQEAWLRWSGRDVDVASPRAWLATVVTRLCLNELDSARHRKEDSRSDRLPEPADLAPLGLDRLEAIERVSMAFLVALQRLTPAERAVLLLHDVFDFEHGEIGALVGRSGPACRKLLERARASVATEKRFLAVSREAHERLLSAFVEAAYAGDSDALVSLLAEDAMLVADGGTEGRVAGGIRNLRAPLRGAAQVAAFVALTSARVGSALGREIRDLNGLPALVLGDADGPFAAITLAVDEHRIHRVYFHGDLRKLGHVGGPLT
jgi:RNA polymerase sigma-70 factor (ECF subfamily)